MTDQELNEAVARKIGWNEETALDAMPLYSTDIKAAWEIVEHLDNHSISLSMVSPTARWHCSIFSWEGYPDVSERRDAVEGEANSAPRAICEAFLKLT